MADAIAVPTPATKTMNVSPSVTELFNKINLFPSNYLLISGKGAESTLQPATVALFGADGNTTQFVTFDFSSAVYSETKVNNGGDFDGKMIANVTCTAQIGEGTPFTCRLNALDARQVIDSGNPKWSCKNAISTAQSKKDVTKTVTYNQIVPLTAA